MTLPRLLTLSAVALALVSLGLLVYVVLADTFSAPANPPASQNVDEANPM